MKWCVVLVLSSCAFGASKVEQKIERGLDAMERVESKGNLRAIGDQGRSHGILQIQKAYWDEACKFGGVSWKYNKLVWDRKSSRQVVKWYMQLYAPEAYKRGDMRVLSRVHNGGPAGASKSATLDYWQKVKKQMQ